MKSFKRKFAAFMAVVLAFTSFNFAGWAYNSSKSNDGLKFSLIGEDPKSSFSLKENGDAITINVTASPSDADLTITKVTVATGSNAIQVATESNASLQVTPLAKGTAKVDVEATMDDPATGSSGTITLKGSFNVTVEETIVPDPGDDDGDLIYTNKVTVDAGGSMVEVTVDATPSNATLGAIIVDQPSMTDLNAVAEGNTIKITAGADASGITDVTFHTTVNNHSKDGSIKVTVKPVIPPTVTGDLVCEPKEVTVEAGNQKVINVKASPSDANLAVKDLSVEPIGVDGVTVTADSDNNTITIAADNTVTNIEKDLQVYATVGSNTVKSGAVVHVTIIGKTTPPDTGDKVSKINVTFNSPAEGDDFYVGQRITATAQVIPATATPTIKWTASGIDVTEEPSKDGMSMTYYAKSAGELTVVASADGISGQNMATVNSVSARMSFNNSPVVLSSNGSYDFSENLEVTVKKPATGTLHDDLEAEIKNSVVYESSDKEVLVIDASTGLAKAVKSGEATVTAKSPINNVNAVTCRVQVLNDNKYQLVIDPVAAPMDVNFIQKITATVLRVDDGKDPVKIKDLTAEGIQLKWTSSNTNVATVDTLGMVTSKADGTADVVAVLTDKAGKELASQTCVVTVKKIAPIADGAVVNNYKDDEDINAVLNAEDPSKVPDAQAKAAADKLADVVNDADMTAMLKNGAETARVMNDIATLENVLILKGIAKPIFKASGRIKGVEADGLAMNAFKFGTQSLQMVVTDASVETPQAMAGKTILDSFGIDIDVTGISGDLYVPVRIRLVLPSGYNANNTSVIHYGQNGIEIVPNEVINGKLVFTVADLSPFAIVKTQSTPGGGGTPSTGGGSSSSTKTVKAAPSIPETPGFWFATAAGWQFYTPEGVLYVNTWIYVGGQWYWVDAAGTMGVGWTQINGKMYYMNPANGAMQVGWIAIAEQNTWYYTDASGAMVTGWQQINGSWYYFDANGAMLANANTPDGYYVNADGVWVQ